MTAKTTKREKKKIKPALSAEELQQLEEAHVQQTLERQAETQLELAKLFLAKEKRDIALRRLKELIADYGNTTAAQEARSLLKSRKP